MKLIFMKKVLFSFLLGVTSLGFSQMTMIGSASQMSGGCDCYQLTPNSANLRGAIWSPQAIDLTNPFDMTFNVYLGAFDGADGMMFVLQQFSTGVGDVGANMGYKDVAPLNAQPISTMSLGIELDTWPSAPAVPGETIPTHTGINSNGSNDHNILAPIALPSLENGGYHSFRVVWNPTLNIISMILDGTPYFAHNINIPATIFAGNPIVYFGFTAATGGATNEHRVCMYRNASFTQTATSVCPEVPITFTSTSTSDLNNIIQYSWDFGDGSPLGTGSNPTHTYTTPGNYTVELTMMDISGCTDVATVSITVQPDLTVNLVPTNISCFGEVDGEATATPTNGTSPYTYLWDDGLGQTTTTATGLAAGTYTVIVTDANSCDDTLTTTIIEPTEIFITGVMSYDNGTSNGAIDATITGGTTPYASFLWSTTETIEDISGLAAGDYTLTVTDDNGCTKDTTFTVLSSVGLDDLGTAGFVIYPNPTQGVFNVKGIGSYGLIVADAAGRVVHAENTTGTTTVNMNDFERGIYFVQITIGDARYMEKIILH